MINELLIRPPVAADFAAWEILWDGYNAFYGRSGETRLALDVTRETWRRFFDPNEDVYCLLALEAGTILGMAHYLFHRNTIMIAPTCYMQDLFTAEGARGKGVARALVDEMYRAAQEAGITSVYWHTHRSNSRARRLYDSVATDTDFTVYRRSLVL